MKSSYRQVVVFDTEVFEVDRGVLKRERDQDAKGFGKFRVFGKSKRLLKYSRA